MRARRKSLQIEKGPAARRRPPQAASGLSPLDPIGYSAASASGATEMNRRPLRPLWNTTLPVPVAKIV